MKEGEETHKKGQSKQLNRLELIKQRDKKFLAW